MKRIAIIIAAISLLAVDVYSQDQTIDGNVSVGVDGGAVTGEGKRLYFNGVQSNSDPMFFTRFNPAFNSSDLRLNIGDDYGRMNDRFVIGTTKWSDGQFYPHLTVLDNGYLGIGQHSPNSMLTIRNHNSGVSVHPGNAANYFGCIAFNREAGTGAIYNASGNAYQIDNGGTDANLHFQVYNGSGTIVQANALVVSGAGYIGMGTANPKEQLSVNGNIRAREIKVETQNWPDYVFSNSHQKPSLPELENYIKANNHLPEIPSAKEAETEGISLGEMNKKLLQKVEELTLYLIEQDKKNRHMQQKLEQQEKLIQQQNNRLQKLENKH